MHSKTRSLILAALFAALTAIGAFLKIPLGALSLTLQFLSSATRWATSRTPATASRGMRAGTTSTSWTKHRRSWQRAGAR